MHSMVIAMFEINGAKCTRDSDFLLRNFFTDCALCDGQMTRDVCGNVAL